MKKVITILFILLAFESIGFAQNSARIDSLRHELSIATHDTTRMAVLIELSVSLRDNRPDSAIYYANKGLILARKFNSPDHEINAMISITLSQIFLGNESSALKVNLEAKKLAEIYSLKSRELGVLSQSGLIYNMSHNYSEALNVFRTVVRLADSTNNIFWSILGPCHLAETFLYIIDIEIVRGVY